MPFPALPLNTPSRTATTGSSFANPAKKQDGVDTTPTASSKHSGPTPKTAGGPPGLADISSPHELTAFVETLLEQLENKFDDISTQILDRMTQMSGRVDALEAAIHDIITSGDNPVPYPFGVPQSPSPLPTILGARR